MKDDGLTELHIVNGLHPTLPWRYYPRVLRELKAVLPDVALKAFTATEVHYFEEISGLSADEVLDELIDGHSHEFTNWEADAFPSMRADLLAYGTPEGRYKLSDTQRASVERAHERLVPEYKNLVSDGLVPLGREVETPAVLQRLPMKPPVKKRSDGGDG